MLIPTYVNFRIPENGRINQHEEWQVQRNLLRKELNIQFKKTQETISIKRDNLKLKLPEKRIPIIVCYNNMKCRREKKTIDKEPAQKQKASLNKKTDCWT